jgi:hypothetical protein
MIKHCPNKNLPEYTYSASILGDKLATNTWYENGGNPIWLTNSGVDSPLWSALLSHSDITSKDQALIVISYAHTKSFKEFKNNLRLNEFNEPSANALIAYVTEAQAKQARMEAYKAYKLVDKVDPSKPIKWLKTDANYKKVLTIAQKINADGKYTAKIIPIPVAETNKNYISIALLPKTAFITEEGEQIAHYDATSGTITFTGNGVTAETVVHEFAHPFVDALAANNPELFSNLLANINKDQHSVDAIKKIKNHIETHYKEASQEIKDKELLAYTISEYGRGNIDANTGKNTVSAIERFYKWLTSVVKDLVDQMKTDKVLYVNQISPKTKYKEIADLFTVFSEVGTINLGVSPSIITEKTDLKSTDESLDKKKAAFKAKMAARKAAKTSDGNPAAFKMINTPTAHFVNIKDEATHMASLLPKDIAMELTPGYVKVLSGGRAVVGMFQNAMISLSSAGPKGTAYHEGFHAVFRTLLNSAEQDALISEISLHSVFPTSKEVQDLQMEHDIPEYEAIKVFYEEILADKFAEYMERPKSVVGRIAQFFKNIKDWITNVFSNTTTVDAVFRDIKLGKYKKQTPNIVRGVAYRVHPLISVQDVSRITRELASVAFENVSTIEDLKTTKIKLETISDKLADVGITAEEAGNDDLVEQLSILFDEETGELDKFWLREIDSYLRNSLGLKAVVNKKGKTKDDKITDEDQDEQNLEDLEKDNFLKSSYEVSGKVNATAAVKFMVAMTPQVINTKPESPISVSNLEYVTSTLTGLPVLVDFGAFYNDLENILSDIVPIQENGVITDGLEGMLTAMRTHAKYKPEMIVILDKLDNASEEIRSQFFSAFSRQKGSFVHHQVKGVAENNTINSEFTTSNFSTKSTVIRNNWVAAFIKNFGKREDGHLIYNKEKQERFAALQARLKELVIQEVAAVEAGKHKLSKNVIGAFETTLKFLGVNVGPHTINYIVESRIPEDYELDYDIEYAQQFENLVYEFLQATNDLIKREGSIYGNNNHIQDNTKFFKNILAEAEAYFKKVPGENAFVGPEGNSIYSYQDNDSVSKAVNAMKAGDLTHLERVVQSAYGKNSLWVNELLYGDKQGKIDKNTRRGVAAREDFSLQMYGNLKSEETAGDTGAKASKLKPGDAYMDNVNKTMNGYYIGLAEADKSRQTYFKGPKFRKIGFTFTTNAEGKAISSIKNKEGLTILKGYFADELSRMAIANSVIRDTDTSKAAPEKDWILYYHYYPVAPGTGTIGEKLDKIPGNALNSFLFPDIDLVALGLQTSDGTFLAKNEINFDNNKQLDAIILQSFATLVQKELKQAIKLGLITKSKEGHLENRLISQDVIAKYTQGGVTYLEQLMGDYVLNTLIGNIEQTKLFNGDPAIYKVKGVGKKEWKALDLFGDFKKRIPAIYASGKDFRIFNKKDGTPVVRPSYTSAVIENITVPSAFFGTKDENDNNVFNEANLREIQGATGISIEKLKKLFKPYVNINQTDAQAWITLDAYKERLNGLGKWTPYHQSAYEDLISGKNLSPVGLKLLAQPLKTIHAELVPTANGELIMHYNKQSEAVLLPFMKDTQLGNLLTAMENQGVDHVIVLDGKKAGASGITDIVDQNGKIKDPKEFTLNPTKLSYNNLFLQQDLPSKGIKDTLVGSQGTKNVMSVVKLDEKYLSGTKTGREVIDLFHATIGKLSDLGLVDLDAKIGYDSSTNEFPTVEGVSKVHKLIQKEFEGEASENHLSALNENIAFDALPIKNKIMNKLQAVVTKKTVKLKQLGGALVQLSDLGFVATETKLSDKVKNGIIWFKDPRERLNPMHIQDGEVKAAQILIPHGKFLEMLATNEKLLNTIQEKYGTKDYKELTHTQLATLLSKDVLAGLSYRIPNQGPSSNDAFEIVGVLPTEMGDTMVAFSDVTTKTGSDFDIDKSFIILPNFYYSKEAGKIKKVGYDINNITGGREEGLQNLRLDLMREMLMHPAAYASVMAPLDDPWLEDFAKDLFPEDTKLSPMEFFTGRYQLETKITFDGAKALVGAIANHMTNHSLALSDDLYFNGYYLGKGIKRSVKQSTADLSTKMEEIANNSVSLSQEDWDAIQRKDGDMTSAIWKSLTPEIQEQILKCL